MKNDDNFYDAEDALKGVQEAAAELLIALEQGEAAAKHLNDNEYQGAFAYDLDSISIANKSWEPVDYVKKGLFRMKR